MSKTKRVFCNTESDLIFDGGVRDEDMWARFSADDTGTVGVCTFNEPSLPLKHVNVLRQWLEALK